MKTFAERLNAAMTAAGVSQGQLAEMVGISQPAIQKMTSGKTNGSRKMVELANALKVRPEWLSSGIGDMRYEVNKDSSIPPESEWGSVDAWDKNTPLPDDEVEVPFLKDIEFACGDGRVHSEDHNGFKLRFSKATLRRVGANSDGSGVLCFPATGDSMEPVIPDGTTVAVDTNNKRIVDGKLYAIAQPGGGDDKLKRIKQLYRNPGGMLTIRSFNREDETANESDVEIIGRVFWYSVLL
ncbi:MULTISPECIES: XRE family transcriptional regulator [unclassified Citrobacter]|uniref:XRE family transcriptional regulator n=1 Tax=unclassified Citrobacter TaxID=2644389 RepID=UPI0015E9DFBA|nr:MULTISPECIES: helix-turn-helix transcriptional regulator [unclassified Citrobacter]MBA7877235.1 helix-turn-helix transcriptional regulator [Citrobacter sp. RHBSTW-00827]MBA7937722.1 helix-turn-helix transcriptional regulator [Citrobacter sp. RHBSTW-00509]QLS93828.1 helix-turn-helix transcriptional regulator [Citrobacter sp. RHBSTW-00859]QLT53213.1 helix-turn-helix transcriptional regulator [Citrobacter sp. RHBSTW-00821]QLU29498.1 helix-turn-helix transcriptional regulator [Citrobacter sp. R